MNLLFWRILSCQFGRTKAKKRALTEITTSWRPSSDVITTGETSGTSGPMTAVMTSATHFNKSFLDKVPDCTTWPIHSAIPWELESRSENIIAGQILIAENVSIRYEDVVGISIPSN